MGASQYFLRTRMNSHSSLRNDIDGSLGLSRLESSDLKARINIMRLCRSCELIAVEVIRSGHETILANSLWRYALVEDQLDCRVRRVGGIEARATAMAILDQRMDLADDGLYTVH